MKLEPVTREGVRFNPGTNEFEALITLTTEDGTYRYPCMCQGNINMPLGIVIHRLSQQAKNRHTARDDLRAFAALPLGSLQAHLPRAA